LSAEAATAYAVRLLERIEERLAEHGGDLGGWTARSVDALKIFDGRVTLRAEILEQESDRLIHAHVFATLHEHGDEVLEACILGMGENPDEALGQAALIWMQGIGAPIRSFLDGREVCMASRTGPETGITCAGPAYAGPMFPRGLHDSVVAALDDALPWFRYAAESAAPRRVHLAKVSISTGSGGRWTRQLEIDGHNVSHVDPDWPAGVASAQGGYVTRFAVFGLSREEARDRAELDRTIRHFAGLYARGGSVEELMDEMIRHGFDAERIHEVESVSTLAFGRFFFADRGIAWPPTIIRARADSRVRVDVPLLSIPAYSRAWALAPLLQRELGADAFAQLCTNGAEANAILHAMESNEELDLAGITLYPCVVPDLETSPETMDAALQVQRRMMDGPDSGPPPGKPWWKRW